MKRDFTYKLHQLIILTLTWMIMGVVITLYDHLVLISNNAQGPATDYTIWIAGIRNIGAGLIGGVLGGGAMIFYINVKFQHKPYGYTVLAVMVSFVLIVGLITVIMGFIIVPLRTGYPLNHPASRMALIDFFSDPLPLKAGVVWLFVVGITQVLLQVNQKFGRGSFWSLVSGKYQIPQEEEKIFMLLDLNSSTAIAEKIGDKQYHLLLREFFADITNPILNNHGSIYQYVGDEVVVAWSNKEGANYCIQCFFEIQQTIQSKRENYLAHFGVVPSFKAGIHCGKIVAGEVGIIKRDITYSGDVLNTTSRIQSMCKTFEADLIVSNAVVNKLTVLDKYILKPLGQLKLKGKQTELLLNSIEPMYS